MDYKKKYNAALERARQFSEHPLQENSADIVEYIFPELQGDNDERIRKWLIGYFQQYGIDGMEVVYANSLKVDDILAWLEKQGKKIDDAYLQGICDAKHEIEKQDKKLDADDVIAWLVANICGNEYYVKLFKKDFGL